MSQVEPSLTATTPIVCSHNEWDPLEEVVVGRIDLSIRPQGHFYLQGGVPNAVYQVMRWVGGTRRSPYKWCIEPSQKELDGFIRILEAEGVKVRRPDQLDHKRPFRTPYWWSRGHTTACPRDCFLVIGDEIIEAPMSWRNRYFERHAYYRLFKEYFDAGAKWTSAPKPPLRDELYNWDYKIPQSPDEMRYIINESEVVFDAADFMRCGRDLFVARSNVTNRAGIAWVRRHLGDRYRVHEIKTRSLQPMHIDTTFVPLAPGKLLYNPKYLDLTQLPPVLKSWELLEAPPPIKVGNGVSGSLSSLWLSMNVLSLDEKRVIVERDQTSMIDALRKWGFEPIPCKFGTFGIFGGAFHCATLDIRRRGTLQEYF
jgi:glycine amidinotransferase